MDKLTAAEAEHLIGEARRMRRDITELYVAAGGGHFGGSLSVVEILATLYGAVMRYDPKRPDWPDRDRLILSKGHACGALCPALAHAGFFDEALLATFNKLDSPFGMHPDMHKIPGCDMSTGSLGHGLAVGLGMAIAARADRKDYHTYVVMGDGECNEGSVWEAAQAVSHFKLDNLTAIVDRNRVMLDGETEVLMALEPFADRWQAFGWRVIEANGHDVRALHNAIGEAKSTRNRPAVVIAKTIKGKGISFMEGKHEYHYGYPTGKDLELARQELGGNN